MIITKPRFFSKPLSGRFEIDWSHPLAIGLQHYLLFNSNGRATDLAKKFDFTSAAALKAAAGIDKIGMELNDGDSESLDSGAGLGHDASGTNKLTLAARYALTDTAATLRAVFLNNGTPALEHFIQWQMSPSTLWFQINSGGASRSVNPNPGTPSLGQIYTHVGTYDQANLRVYLDAAELASLAATDALRASSRTTVNKFFSGGSPVIGGDAIYTMVSVHNRALSAAEVLWYTQEPWVVLRPLIRRTYVMVAAEAGAPAPESTGQPFHRRFWGIPGHVGYSAGVHN